MILNSIYIYNIIFIALSSFVSSLIPNKKYQKLFFLFLVTVILLITQGLRADTVGSDLIVYQSHYTYVAHSPFTSLWNFRFEPAYSLLVYFLSKIQVSFQVFIFLISFFNLIVLAWFNYNYSVNPLISYILYIVLDLYAFGFSALRQSIAMSIILLSWKFLYNKDIWKYGFTVFIAGMFHYSALISFILYFLVNTNFRKIYKKIYVLLLIFTILVGSRLVQFLLLYFRDSTRVLDSFAIGNEDLLILLIFILGLLSYYLMAELRSDKLFTMLLIVSSFSVIIQILAISDYLFTRLNFYFYQYLILFLPLIYMHALERISNKNIYFKVLMKFLITLIIIIISVYFHSKRLSTNPNGILPHIFFWNN